MKKYLRNFIKKIFQKIKPEVKDRSAVEKEHIEEYLEDRPTQQTDLVLDNSMTQELMILIGKAIEEWLKKYNMTKIPREYIFEIVLDIMHDMWRDIKENHDENII